MGNSITLDPGAEAVLLGLQPLFVPYGTARPVYLDHPEVVAEFRPGSDKNTDLANVPKPVSDWAFGVELGAIHENARLCALVFSKWENLQTFYAANPALSATLVTFWRGGGVIWLRCTGRIPNNFVVDGVHFCPSGLVPVGCPLQSPESFVSQPGEIKLIDFSQLAWTEQQQAEIERLLLEAEVGAPIQVGARGRRMLNLAFWARYFTDMMPITFDPDRSLFAWGDAKVCEPALLTMDETVKEFSIILQAAAPSLGATFPQSEIRTARVRQLVERVKLLVTKSRPSDGEVLDSFLASEMVRAPDKVITSFEFRARYVTYCQGCGRTLCSKSRFFRALKAKLHGMGIDQRHDIDRRGKQIRGYGGLTFKPETPTKGPDGSDGTDGTDGA